MKNLNKIEKQDNIHSKINFIQRYHNEVIIQFKKSGDPFFILKLRDIYQKFCKNIFAVSKCKLNLQSVL